MKENNFRAGFVALIGEPNVGKSSLMNAFLGEKASIVSSKPQTTRQSVRGIYTSDTEQIVFVDAPGMQDRQDPLHQFMRGEVQSGAQESDVQLLLFSVDDVSHPQWETSIWPRMIKIKEMCRNPLPLLTKADRLEAIQSAKRHEVLRERFVQITEHFAPHRMPSVSALQNPERTRQSVLSYIREHLPLSPAPLYDPELWTTQTLREMAAELIREACFIRLHQEVPFGIAIRVQSFEEPEHHHKPIRISAEILVNKDNHRGIVIGENGSMISTIGRLARQEIEKLTQRKVYLELNVRVRANWVRNPRLLKELGYVLP